MLNASWRRSLEIGVGLVGRLMAALTLMIAAAQSASTLGQEGEATGKPATAENAVKEVPNARPLPALQLAQRGVIIRRGFRGQIGPDGLVAAGDGDVNYALFPGNRELVRQLEQAGQLVTDGHLADGFQFLDDILGEGQDFFYQPDRDKQLYRSLKAEARRLIGSLPAEAIAQYDLQFGATARHLLDKAVVEADTDGVAAVVRRYFNTQAGFEAAWLLGRQHLDHSQTLAAALTFQMLYDSPRARERFEPALSLTLATCWLRAGVTARAEMLLSDLRKHGSRPRIAEKDVPLFADDANALEWLIANTGTPPEEITAHVAQWSLHRGNPSRNAASSGGSPLLSTPRWQQTLASDAKPTPASETMSKQLVDTDQIDLLAETPLAVGETAIVRTPRWVVGVHLQTGKRIWEYPTWENDNYNPRQQVMNPMTGSMLTVNPEKLSTRSTIASDGRAVFIVEDRGNQPFVFAGMFNAFGRVGRGSAPNGPGSYNKLLARELATEGKLLWEVGGESGEAEPQLAGVYFLGAPLAIGGQLYVIGELKGEITLFVLDAQSGRFNWSQPLATVESTVATDSFRRMHGAMPSFADGVMVCPTSAGAVVAVDVANRSLLWGFQYPRNQAINPYRGRRSREISNPFDGKQWTDGSVILAAGRALIAPADSDFLHCINLVDGKEGWKVPRAENLYVGGVFRDTVLVVGRQQIHGVKLGDGQSAWPAQPIGGESGGVPSGRGFLSGGHYYLPLSTAEVAKIDLADGKIKARVKSRKGYVPGNLVCYKGHVLSLNEDSLDCFFQLDEREQWAAETLRVRPDDPDALAMFGEILVDQGKLTDGLVQLERAFALAPNERVRELLIEAHLELLRQDFAGHRERAGEIEQLLREPDQKAALAREMALGLQKLGEDMAAFEYYVKMCQPGEHSQELETVAPNQLSVRRDRWVRAKVAELRAAVSSEERQKMDERIAAHFVELGGPTNVAALRQLLDYFGDDASVGKLRGEFVDRLIEAQEFLEAEWWLLRQARSSNKQEAAVAYLRLADLMLRLNRPDDAASCYRQLTRRFGDQVVADEQTGTQTVEALPDDSPVQHYLSSDRHWPKEVVKQEHAPRSLDYSGVQLEVSSGREPFFDHLTLELDPRRQQLLIRDGYGRERFQLGLNDSRRPARSVNYSSVPWARANGHILLIQERTQILAVDALTSPRDGKSRVLWRHDLADLIAEGGGMVIRSQQVGNRRVRSPWFDQTNRPIGGIWPVGYELVCLQRGNKLVGIDVFSGQVLWTRHDIAPAGEIFGDEEYLFVVPYGGDEATVLRTLDGAKVGTRTVPVNDRYATHGRKVVQLANRGGKTTVRVTDVWAGEQEREIWKQDFASSAKVESIDSDEIAILDTSGKFVIYSLDDDKQVVETKLKAEHALTDLQVFRTSERYVVLAARPLEVREGLAHRYAVQNNGSRSQPVVEGRVYGFERRTGKLLWENDFPATATLLNQPAHVPLLVFAMNVNEQSRVSAQRATTSVLCLDTRDGRIVYNEKLPGASTTVVAAADPEHQKLEIHRNTSTVSLTFGDKKPEPDQPAGGRPGADRQQGEKDDAAAAADQPEQQPAAVPARPADIPSR
ncbi:MAG: PQQ-binding-like beta-propeller repeat protein [Pirellulales bacterium]